MMRDSQKSRFCTVRELMGQLTLLPTPAPADWPYRGPSATYELLVAIRAVSDDFGQLDLHFVTSSGLGQEHPVAIKHRELLMIMHHLTCFDQLSVTQLAGAECCSRFVLQIHQAVKRNEDKRKPANKKGGGKDP